MIQAKVLEETKEEEKLELALRRLESFAELTDSKFRLPVIGVRIGIESIIGLIPGVGDVIGVLMALYLFGESVRMGTPWRLRLRMLINIGLDFLVGLIPLIGDIADIAFKANTRNVRLLRTWAESHRRPPASTLTLMLTQTPGRFSRWLPVALMLLVVVASAWALYALFIYFQTMH